ncbi:hypothetical protein YASMINEVIRUS_857 [Yasminevirus sp. GU-2018]|uniref:Uncharacterized protein n=1 Tax=Yasminevirus sp. GU-2018 TaxID=2420051 RepID=A0A5K0UAA2_9VIRU|nr:hypothetical protein YASMINEVIRUS_857 [Yasminevirus sp. GU-2018]
MRGKKVVEEEVENLDENTNDSVSESVNDSDSASDSDSDSGSASYSDSDAYDNSDNDSDNSSSDNSSSDNSSSDSDSISDDESDAVDSVKKKTKTQERKEANIKLYMKPPTKDDLQSWRFSRRVNEVLESNNLEVIDTQLGVKVFKQLYNMKDDIKGRYRHRLGRRASKKQPEKTVTRGQKILNRTIGSVFTYYLNNVLGRKQKHHVEPSTRVKIVNMILEYYHMCGKSAFLVGNLIKCKMWGVLAYINCQSPIEGKDISLKSVDNALIETMQKKGINLTGDYELVLRYGTSESQLKYFQSFEVYGGSYIPVSDLMKIKGDTVFEYLYNDGKIDVSKTAVKSYHEKCAISLLRYLVSSDIVKVDNACVKKIFKKKISKNKKRTDDKNTIRHRRRRWSRRHMYDKKAFNKNASGKDFKENIIEYLKLVSEKGCTVPIANCVKYTFMSNKMYTQFVDLIDILYKEQKGVKFNIDNHEQYRIFSSLTKTDDIDRFHKLIDNNVVQINTLHKDNEYISKCLSDCAEKIAKYMVTTLKVKYVTFSPTELWGWSMSEKNDKIIRCLRLMKELDIIVPESLLTRMMNKKKSSQVLDVLINEFGMKIKKEHMKHLTGYPIAVFNKYTKDLDFNKKTLIRSLIGTKRKTRYYWRAMRNTGSKNMLALHLISKLPIKTRVKEAKKYCTQAILYDNTSVCSTLKKRYNVDVDLSQIKSAVNKNTLNVEGTTLIKTLVTMDDRENDIARLREAFTDDEILLLIQKKSSTNGYYYGRKTNKPKTDLPIGGIIRDLKLQCKPERLQEIVTSFLNSENRRWDDTGLNSEQQDILVNIIKGTEEYVKNDETVMKQFVEILWRNNADTAIGKLHTKKHDCYSYITAKAIYTKLLDMLYTGKNIDAMIKLIVKHKSDHLTPYIYKVLALGLKAGKYNHDVWSRSTVQRKTLQPITTIVKTISQEIYLELKDVCAHVTWFVSNKKLKTVAHYEPDPDEVPDTVEFYNQTIAGGERRENRNRRGRRIRGDDDEMSDDSVEIILNENRAIEDDLEKAMNGVKDELQKAEIEKIGTGVDKASDDEDAISLDSDDEGDAKLVVPIKKVAKKVSKTKKATVYKKINQN